MQRQGTSISRAQMQAATARVLLLALLWWALTEGEGAWLFGAPIIAIALAASLWLLPARREPLSALGLIRFGAYFLVQSLRGGIDVARRTFDPRLPLTPALLRFEIRLRALPARSLLVNALTLLPGTLAVNLEDQTLEVHVLDAGLPIERELRSLERHVARLFGDT